MSPVHPIFTPDHDELRLAVRRFVDTELRPHVDEWEDKGFFPDDVFRRAGELGFLGLHYPEEWGGAGGDLAAEVVLIEELGQAGCGAIAMALGVQTDMATPAIAEFGTDDQKERYLRPLLEGRIRSCFAMTEPEVAGSDPTGIQTTAELDEKTGEWVINGHKWFTSGARGAGFAILIAKTDPDADPPQATNTAFIVDLPADGWEMVRDIETMAGHGNHCEIRITDLRVPDANVLGGRGNGHLLGQARLGPARLAHCMRWIGQIETALEMLVARAEERQLHGAPLAEKQAIQWMMADSAMELYTGKLMVLHAAYKIEHGMPFRQEVSFAKHHVANTLWRVVDRAIQVHGALGYSTDTPLERMLRHARSARLVDGADEVHQALIARNVRAAYAETGSLRSATGDLDL